MPLPLPISGQNWLITPAATAFGEPAPTNISQQQWLLILSGVAVANFQGNSTALWNAETVTILPDLAGPTGSGPLNWAVGRYSIPKPPQGGYNIGFSLDNGLWVPFAALSKMIDQNQSINAGYAVELWRPTPFIGGTDAFSGASVGNIFAGIDVDLSVRDSDAFIEKVSYNISLLGKIVFFQEASVQLVSVPNVTDIKGGLPAAISKLESVGLRYKTNIHVVEGKSYSVTDQSPQPGTMVPKNTQVSLTIELSRQ
jgi:hypothetical protein